MLPPFAGGAGALNELFGALAVIKVEDPSHLERLQLIMRVRQRAWSIIEVACWDAVAREAGCPLYDLLGGLVRPRVQFASYLFYKYEGDNDPWGEVNDPEAMVGLAHKFREQFGFSTIKLKGGVLPPDAEIDTMRLLHKAFPKDGLRIDPKLDELREEPEFHELLKLAGLDVWPKPAGVK